MPKAKPKPVVDAVVIGRNEGARLVACLASLAGQVRHVVYVDSGSTDGSQQAAREAGAEVIELDMTQPFTAARARNAGLKALRSAPPDFVQFIDGDCILREGWMPRAMAFLAENLRAAVVCGRRREQYPENSVYNTLIDAEWNTPVGESRACGGDALMRYQAVTAVRGFRDDLIAGEEPELCLRLRAQGWTVWRIEAEMTWHDAGITRFSQWWKRTERAGYAFTEGATRFHTPQAPHWQAEANRIWVWGVAIPLVALLGSLWHPAALLVLLVYPLQVVRLHRRLGWSGAFFNTLGKFPEAVGALRFHIRRFSGARATLIEYK
ncbi:MAG: glycosyltransferase family 2 protein [Rhodobacter sp.]|uniref:glycosyltransferase n=1 Tax=Pararhodobacter sp. TaxID=2127056 RepID=UPI002BC2123A|nr:glycosyltransferase [Pararhodobacter sp.]MCC0072361.1 glycosyltransferase family 2 protein [Rhodobacter sp.]HPD91892.1 glycosyltransferase [Pararhodobacter sp.]